MASMLLAADVGGTKTLMGLFRPDGERPRSQVMREFATLDFDSLDDIVRTFIDETGVRDIEAGCIGVAGPVTGMVARLTNVPWLADASAVAEDLGCPVQLVNDLEAMAYSVPVLEPDELAVLQDGDPVPTGNAALIAAGTGLGEALLHNVNGRFLPSASEGGHADFSARTRRELALVAELTRIYGRVDVERVVSGPGLVNVFGFTHGTTDTESACDAIGPDVDPEDLPAAISKAAIEGRCEQCMEALDIWVEAYGAEAGNLALRSVATAGVYIGGGIAPKLLQVLEQGAFMDAFRAKDPMVDMLRTLPVMVILNPAAGLLGAAVKAASLQAV
ncbi:MAG TPA: glucokinase [Vicinamibacterales bacterium]|nr:glucokinase [Vicinamibacterales bacterium]